jgi:hypothetical protein
LTYLQLTRNPGRVLKRCTSYMTRNS